MTLEDLLDCDAAKLKAMTEQELDKHFSPYYTVTRPELAAKQPKPQQITMFSSLTPEQQHEAKKKAELLKSMGIDFPVANMMRKKR